MKFNGLSQNEVEESRKKNGSNTLTQIPPDPLWKKILEGFKDPMIMILLVALVVQVVLFFLHQAEWFEPVGILVAIMIANGVASFSENKQEGKASALKAEEEAKEMAKVIRDGKLEEIHVSEVVVGDIVFLQAGDKIPADGEIVDGAIKVDQAALNGETEEADKIPMPNGESYDTKDLLNKYYAYRGTVVCGGEAYMEIKVVGDKTLFGELALEVQEDTRETPLQVKLGKLAKQISTFGYIGAICIVVGVLAKTLISGAIPSGVYEWIRLVMDAITVAVTIIVCAVPEGLPMLTSILLSFQSLKMAKDNVLVRKINGMETAGSLSILFSDKTGTISGTEVAKEAGDITILDDNFSSIEKAILYGRTMFKSIRKFLIFQLTVNVAAVLTCFIGPLLGENVIMTVIQLLLVNLAMDTLAAIAFGSEPALKEYMKDKPIPRSASIISKDMLVEIIISALYITVACLGILFIPAIRNLFGDVDITYLKSAVFATFMMAITFNGFNARTNHINVLEGIGKNKSFLLVMFSIFALQFVFVTFGGSVLSVEALSPSAWLICIVMAVLVIPIDMVRKAIMGKPAK